MNKRDILLMGGAPGSGKTRLSRSIEQHLRYNQITAEHISVGNRIRGIGAGIIRSAHVAAVLDLLNSPNPSTPLDDEVMFGIVSEALHWSATTDIVLLDGYPRYESQVETTLELALKDERLIKGMLVTITDDEASLIRMLKRGQKDHTRLLTFGEAIDKLAEFHATFPKTLSELAAKEVPILRIDTSGSKTDTDTTGNRAAERLLR